jgi:type IV secretory pathway TraG/TraD family ATPase VirD4
MGRIWLFDLQKIANHEPDFWWNPLTYITDDDTAEKAVSVLAVDGVPTGGGGGSAEFFHKAASRLLKCLLLAAALDRKPAPIVAAWAAIPTDASEAAEILDRHGWIRLANEVRAAVASPSDQRGGVFETALNWASVFTMSKVQGWITEPSDGRPHFDPHTFVRSKDTAYVLSRGKGDGSSAGPIATLLTVAVCEAAEELAANQGGRLDVPLVCQLDEAGNVLRWPAMAEKYTHYGSRGILLSAMFQSWSQGVATFGKEGWSTLWDAAGVAVYGGGVKDTDPLRDFSQLIGHYQFESVSRSSGGSGGSTSRSTQTERVLDVADLGAIPFGRVIAFGGSAAPVLVETEFWFNTPLGKQAQQATTQDEAATNKPRLDLDRGRSLR